MCKDLFIKLNHIKKDILNQRKSIQLTKINRDKISEHSLQQELPHFQQLGGKHIYRTISVTIATQHTTNTQLQ